MSNIIYNEDCNETLKRLGRIDYVFTVPPDFNELDLNPIKNEKLYKAFLLNIFEQLMARCDTITIAITDRKFNRKIISKHSFIISQFLNNNFSLISHKIWKKTDKINLYRLTYTHIMTFSKVFPKQNHPKIYETDVYTEPEEKYDGYPYGIPSAVVKRLILNFTKEGDVIYDPFMGSFTTAIACEELNRNWIGSEINTEYCKLGNKRLIEFRNKVIKK